MSPFLSVPDLSSGVSRQPSGDGRQVPGTLFTLGGNGMPETPPPMDGAGSKEERGPDRVHGEILRAMSAFFHIGQIDNDWGDPKIPDRLTETSQEHYFVNDSIITVKTLIEHVKDRDRSEGSLKESDGDDVFISSSEQPKASETPQHPAGNFNEQRRRHQSAIQTRRVANQSSDESTPRKTLDDMYATAGPLRRNSVSRGVWRLFGLTGVMRVPFFSCANKFYSTNHILDPANYSSYVRQKRLADAFV
ncbi:hypothetical protein ANCCAN_27477 [Ancylostoma caninum]|uniref:Uncharacterized protein n=1 Tax=Ancylostoma caninum TaxID=29170 RepID=A0A368F9E1_ANCCA|nr:hypothetical protein ANCCAN_27477 [Ancylostoma caninum]